MIDTLLDEYTDAQVAHQLNERGLRTGAGAAFDPVSVQWVRFSHKLTNLKARLLAAGWRTSTQIEATLGVGRTTLGRWRAEGRITGRICNDRGEWLYWPPERALNENAGDPLVPMTTGTGDNIPAGGAV